MSGQHSVWMTWGVGLLTLLILFTIFLIPLNSDSDIYQSMAVDLWRYGKLPYMESWDHNFPGIVYLHWISLTLFGNSDFSFRLFDLAANGLTAFLLYKLTKQIVDRDTALLAPLTYSIYYVSGGWWAIGQRDVFAACFLLLAVWLHVSAQERVSLRRSMLIGAMIGCSALIRPTYALLLPLLALRPFSVRDAFRLTLGFLIPFASFLSGYLLANGDAGELYRAIITYNTQAYGGLAEPWKELISRSAIQISIAAFAVVGAIVLIRQRRGERSTWALLAAVLTGSVSVLVMRKFFVYHFHVLFVFLIPIALLGVSVLMSRIAKPAYRALILGSVLAILVIAFYPRHLPGIALRSDGSVSERVLRVQTAFSFDSSFGRAVDLDLARYLGHEKNVELVSVTPAVQWMNELDRPSRFTMIHCLTTIGASGKLTPFQLEWRAEYLSALEKRKPRIIALADGPGFLMKYIRRTPKDLALEIQGENGQLGFAQLLEQHYVLDTTIGGYYIYKRNAP